MRTIICKCLHTLSRKEDEVRGAGVLEAAEALQSIMEHPLQQIATATARNQQ
jgi:hypothetical protein